ncbi:calcium-binding protein KIC and related proteins [Marchantia polymorpha subsp. ruderalis]|nr:hypothetical protein MARPO_0010s0016 [Marchantia polymorpha]BBN12967.1 hypothetical protein Mp_5g24400 [Marchantia polymorpha subsp. ruderalis]BBN12968.1 hypothetical protein Mp_5g24410 [Marchantia polymorpha subsp. ruderalis]|eukprot:PTQ46603.1 hypothetical protein MARPO_0010s0016 [Marchantia polymorpha]
MADMEYTISMGGDICFQDFLPIMAQKIGPEDFSKELCNGFCMLADPRTNTITIQSLKKNARRLGLEGITDQEFREMIAQGDLDGDGVLSEREFCALMIRSSPALLAHAETWLLDALDEELRECMEDMEEDDL